MKNEVKGMFDAIAPTYDRLNHLLSAGVDRSWRRKVVKMAGGRDILDVATGTGDLAILLSKKTPSAHITGVDVSGKMLEIARKKAPEIEFRVGDAEKLEFEDNSFDLVTCAFGVRNFGDIEAGLSEMHRVLNSGGGCMILEFSEPRGVIFGPLYRFYFHRILPLVGRAVSKNRGAYAYLPASVDGFPPPEEFMEMLRKVGFSDISAKSLTFGIAYIYISVKR